MRVQLPSASKLFPPQVKVKRLTRDFVSIWRFHKNKDLTLWEDVWFREVADILGLILPQKWLALGESKTLLDLLGLVHLQPTYKHIQLWEKGVQLLLDQKNSPQKSLKTVVSITLLSKEKTPKKNPQLLCVSLPALNQKSHEKISGRKMSGPHDGSVPVASLRSVDPPSIAKPFGPLHRSPLQRMMPGWRLRKRKKKHANKWQSMLDSNSASFWYKNYTKDRQC